VRPELDHPHRPSTGIESTAFAGAPTRGAGDRRFVAVPYHRTALTVEYAKKNAHEGQRAPREPRIEDGATSLGRMRTL
jgi:hypothetical protein